MCYVIHLSVNNSINCSVVSILFVFSISFNHLDNKEKCASTGDLPNQTTKNKSEEKVINK